MKNLKQGRNRSYVCYLPLKEKIRDFNELKISVSYSLGGMNYFSGKVNPRSYKIYFKPITVTKCNGYSMESSILMGSGKEAGYYISIEIANRFSTKRLLELAEKFDPKMEALRECFETEDKRRLFSIVSGEEPDHVEQTDREAVSQAS